MVYYACGARAQDTPCEKGFLSEEIDPKIVVYLQPHPATNHRLHEQMIRTFMVSRCRTVVRRTTTLPETNILKHLKNGILEDEAVSFWWCLGLFSGTSGRFPVNNGGLLQGPTLQLSKMKLFGLRTARFTKDGKTTLRFNGDEQQPLIVAPPTGYSKFGQQIYLCIAIYQIKVSTKL